MTRHTLRVCSLVALLAASLPASQLPPEIQVDGHLLRAEEALATDPDAAAAAMDAILRLTRSGSLDLVPDHHYRFARVFERLERWADAHSSVIAYLQGSGRAGDHYADALQLMNRAALLVAAASEGGEAVRRDRERLAARLLAEQEFVDVGPGDFSMGLRDAGRAWQYPRTGVRITRPYAIARHEVTQTLFQAVTGANPSTFQDCPLCPVETVSSDGVRLFLQQANELDPAWVYRLPTEAEWEYAARAGVDTDSYTASIDRSAWHNRNSGGRTHPVGLREPNAFGLYDTLGNVEEIVQDWLAPYPGGLLVDPAGPDGPAIPVGRAGPDRVARGGSWDDNRAETSVGIRRNYEIVGPGVRTQGLRLVRTPR